MKINDKAKSGLWGELYAARYLRDRKYKIVTANFSSRLGEIDIVASDDEYVCYVEVKTRNVNAWYEPKEAVDTAKQNRIIATSHIFEKENFINLQPRFDVCEVFLDDEFKLVKINYIKNAF